MSIVGRLPILIHWTIQWTELRASTWGTVTSTTDNHNRLLSTGLISARNRTEIESCRCQKFLKRSARMMRNGSRCGAGIDWFTRLCTRRPSVLHYVVVYIDVNWSKSPSTIDWQPNVNPMQIVVMSGSFAGNNLIVDIYFIGRRRRRNRLRMQISSDYDKERTDDRFRWSSMEWELQGGGHSIWAGAGDEGVIRIGFIYGMRSDFARRFFMLQSHTHQKPNLRAGG